MPKFSLKTEHFLTPIRLVLPGIIVASTGYYLFNNPDKIRGKNSFTAWNNLVKYEKIYEDAAQELGCSESSNDFETFNKDLIHLQEVTVENLKALRDDKDIDKVMAAIINLRIDTYTQLKILTAKFLDSINTVSSMAFYDSAGYYNIINKQVKIQTDYMNERLHITVRDTGLIRKLGLQLKQTYSAFSDLDLDQKIEVGAKALQKKIIYKWSLASEDIPVFLDIRKDNSGIMLKDDIEYPFTWKLEDDEEMMVTKINLHFTDNSEPDWVITILNCTDKTIQYKSNKKGGMTLIGCRVN